MVQVLANLTARLAGDATWLEMDPSARGFHAQLLLVSAQKRPQWTIPDNGAWVRRIIGLPAIPKPAMATDIDDSVRKLLRNSLGFGRSKGVPESLVIGLAEKLPAACDGWLEWLWNERWWPMLTNAWPLVDGGAIRRFPALDKVVGRRYCEMAMIAQEETRSDESALAKPGRRKRTVKVGTAPTDELSAGEGSLQACDTSALRDIDYVARCFDAMAEPEQRETMWQMGTTLLSGCGMDKAQARAFLGGLIKKHGESEVAKAVATLSVRPTASADPRAFIKGVLARQQHGSQAAQAARKARADVAL